MTDISGGLTRSLKTKIEKERVTSKFIENARRRMEPKEADEFLESLEPFDRSAKSTRIN